MENRRSRRKPGMREETEREIISRQRTAGRREEAAGGSRESAGRSRNRSGSSRKREAEGKRATMVDDRYFHTAEEHLYAELAVVLGMEKDDVRQYIGQKIELLEV